MPYLGEVERMADSHVDSNPSNHVSFEKLVENLRDALGPSSGLDSDDVDPEYIQEIMRSYVSDAAEWRRFALADPSRNYTRNLVDEGNGKSNLLVLVWTPGKESPVHDHANAHCVMKILKGSLTEKLYTMPEANADPPKPLQKTRETVYGENEVTYISDKIGLHKICNTSAEDYAISLHLYTPPHAARHGFNLFDENTGKVSHIKQAGYYSCDGKKV